MQGYPKVLLLSMPHRAKRGGACSATKLLDSPVPNRRTLTKCKEDDTISLLTIIPLTQGANMKEIISSITSKGQVTIPVEVRRHLGIAAHDKIAFVIDSEGVVHLTVPHYPNVASLRGAAG